MTGKKGEIVNLRQARKQRARADKRARADENAVTFGRTKAEREATEAERARATRALDAHRRTPGAPQGDTAGEDTAGEDRADDDRTGEDAPED